MQYFDGDGTWTVNAFIQDNKGTSDTDTSASFTYQELTAIVISPNLITFPEIVRGATNTAATDFTTINNTGNANLINITLNATDFIGETVPSSIIPAGNFRAGNATGSGIECTATTLINSTAIQIANATLSKGNFSVGDGITGQEQIYYCLDNAPASLTKQAYSTLLAKAWILKVATALVVFSLRKKKKKKGKKEQDPILELRDQGYEIDPRGLVISVEDLGERKEAELIAPASIFKNELGPSEALIKYMKENLNLKFSEISKLLDRKHGAIWTTYKNSKAKKISIKEEGEKYTSKYL